MIKYDLFQKSEKSKDSNVLVKSSPPLGYLTQWTLFDIVEKIDLNYAESRAGLFN